jgi:hypothetical protein
MFNKNRDIPVTEPTSLLELAEADFSGTAFFLSRVFGVTFEGYLACFKHWVGRQSGMERCITESVDR